MLLILMHEIEGEKIYVQLFRENLHNVACKQPIVTYVATSTSS